MAKSVRGIPPCRGNLVPQTPSERIYSSTEDSRSDLEPDPLTIGNEENSWQVRDDGKEDQQHGHGDKKVMPLPRVSRKRSRAVARVSLEKRDARRHCFSSPPASDPGTETGDESDTSDYAPVKSRHYPKNVPPSSHCQSDTDSSERQAAGRKPNRNQACQTAVIFEQQRWEGKIIGERMKKRGRGRPGKQYLVEWKPSWVDGSRLTAPRLLRSWKER